jgi:glycosyltransferase involved in cell wall biosynthesis
VARTAGLTVLHVAYPLAPVRDDTAGGAEQVLLQLDAALHKAGHRSIVLGCAGSVVSGELICTPVSSGILDAHAVAAAQHRHAARLAELVHSREPDLVHMHGVDFHCYLPPPGVTTLVSLHLPLSYYAAGVLNPVRPETWLHCVSASQHASRPPASRFLQPIENGVAVPPPQPVRRGDHAVYLGRICPEKGVHLALEAAHCAGVPLLIAGQVFPYESHLAYFEQQVRPLLDEHRRFVGPVGVVERNRLLAAAACVLIPSLVEETSSLVAREALAAGTPVIAFARGALTDIVTHGHDGFLVSGVADMAAAIPRARGIAADTCRDTARRRFPLQKMLDAYFECYRRLTQPAATLASA